MPRRKQGDKDKVQPNTIAKYYLRDRKNRSQSSSQVKSQSGHSSMAASETTTCTSTTAANTPPLDSTAAIDTHTHATGSADKPAGTSQNQSQRSPDGDKQTEDPPLREPPPPNDAEEDPEKQASTLQLSSHSEPSGSGKLENMPKHGEDMELRLIEALNKLGTKLGDKMESLQASVDANMAEMKRDLQGVQAKTNENSGKIQEVVRSLEFSQGDIQTVKEDCKELWSKIRALEKDSQKKEEDTEKLGDKVHDLERRSREYNFRIVGVAEKQKENCPQLVAKLLCESDWAVGSEEEILQNIEVAHRTGKQTTKPRQLIVRCTTRRFRGSVVRAAKVRKRQDGVALFEDLTQRDLQAKKDARFRMQTAYGEGYHVRFYRGKVLIGTKRTVAEAPAASPERKDPQEVAVDANTEEAPAEDSHAN